jgi:hypothetical protein
LPHGNNGNNYHCSFITVNTMVNLDSTV